MFLHPNKSLTCTSLFVKPTGKFFSSGHDDIGHFFGDHKSFGGVSYWSRRAGQ